MIVHVYCVLWEAITISDMVTGNGWVEGSYVYRKDLPSRFPAFNFIHSNNRNQLHLMVLLIHGKEINGLGQV